NALRLAHSLHKPPRLIHGMAHRLLEVHVLALVHGLERDLGVPVIRRRDDDCIDVAPLQDLAVVESTEALEGFFGSCDPLLVDVASGNDLAAVVLGSNLRKPAGNIIAASASADYGDVDPIVGANDASWVQFARTSA